MCSLWLLPVRLQECSSGVIYGRLLCCGNRCCAVQALMGTMLFHKKQWYADEEQVLK
jgi:hypothetical protein